jgi:hypothetical protein
MVAAPIEQDKAQAHSHFTIALGQCDPDFIPEALLLTH